MEKTRRCGMHSRISRSTYKLYIAIVLLLSAIVIDVSMRITIENQKRIQARYNLEQIEFCLNSMVDTNIVGALTVCTSKCRTSETGDVFTFDLDTGEVVYDVSRDVPLGEKFYFNDDNIDKLWYNADSGKAAMYWLESGKDSTYGMNIWYNYDGEPEWLEWINYERDGKKYVIVQGTQQDEVFDDYAVIRYGFLVIMFMSAFVLIASYLREQKNERRK